MPPSLIDTHMLDLLEPLRADIGDIKKRQIANDKAASSLSKEVNAFRAKGKATQVHLAQVTTHKLTTKLEDMRVSLAASAAQSSSSAQHSHALAPKPEHYHIRTSRRSGMTKTTEASGEPEAIRTKLNTRSGKIHGEHMRKIYEQITEKKTQGMRATALPNMPTSGTRFSSVFA